MLSTLLQSPFLSKFEPSVFLEGLWGSPKAILSLLATKKTGKNCVIITGSERHNHLLEDLSYFSDLPLHEFLPWETLPGDEIAPSADIVGKRFEILQHLLTQKRQQIIICPLAAILQKVVSPKALAPLLLHLKKGDEVPFDTLPTRLTELGYTRCSVASEKGEFAVRGGILDIFPLSAYDPYRIDFFGDEIDGMRSYDPISQKSIEKKDNVFIPPANEIQLLEEHSSTLFSYLGEDPLIIFDDLLEIEDKAVALNSLPGAKSPLFTPFSVFLEQFKKYRHLIFSKDPIETLTENVHKTKESITFEYFHQTLTSKRIKHPFVPTHAMFEGDILPSLSTIDPKSELIFLTTSEAEERSLKQQIETPLPEKTTFKRGYLSSGFYLADLNLHMIPTPEITGKHKVRRTKWRNTHHTPAAEFHQLEPGDHVVHFHNGIGKFIGIEKQKNHLGHDTEFFIIEYAKGSKLYTPLSQSHLISRYIGTKEESPPLSILGTSKWTQTKAKAHKAIIGYARDLLKFQALREVKGGFAYPPHSEDLNLFEEEFPFVETEDQVLAIDEIKKDMLSEKAMDRLICGDVGYGKTEVAMRAAFKAVVDGGKQVALLVPTTVLAMQHYDTFLERMANFPINIGVASRFVKRKNLLETLDKVKTGKVDILIGTHRIISKDVAFKDLGLIIIDEEQRFGVRAKEHLKKLKIGVDCLTLSATPIPRTLYYSLVGARDMSVINTPPQDRLPIKTILCDYNPEVIKNALLRELNQDGQAFFVHNRVETIFKVTEELQKLVPSARILAVHGQMSADEIDATFHAFKKGDADILVATTIIESGIDIPNANTILIDRSDRFGLADLYQMRGRVGRWNRPAYAYFLTPKNRSLSEDSRKRLQALVEASGFGGGMKLAMRDLEIRGAGDILGTQQSGNVSAIGFHLYCKMLKRTVGAMKQRQPTTFIETKMEFSFDATLPPSYIAETGLRLEIYHRLGDAHELKTVDDILHELKDRFGKPPLPVQWLYHLTRLRIFASQKGYTLLKFEKTTLLAERGKEKKRHFLPSFASPKELEEKTIQLL